MRTLYINLKNALPLKHKQWSSFLQASLSICLLWQLLFSHVLCPSILSCALLPPPSVVFDESTFILCLTQSSIWLSTLCSNNPHACACTHKWVLLSDHPRAHQAAVRTLNMHKSLVWYTSYEQISHFLLGPHINISELKAAIYSGFKLFHRTEMCQRASMEYEHFNANRNRTGNGSSTTGFATFLHYFLPFCLVICWSKSWYGSKPH